GRIVLTQGRVPAPEPLLEGGAAGLVVVDPGRPRAWHLIYGPEQPLAGRLPMATLGFGDAVDLLRRGVQRLRLEVATAIGPVTGRNVVATLPGPGARRLSVSAHYDSVPSGPAAADNATGAACALEVARALGRSRLDATLDVALFSAEEIGLYGAAAYAARHAGLFPRTELGIYFDGQGDFLGRSHVHVLGQEGLAARVREQIAAVGYAAEVHHHFTGLDQVFLSAAGVPTLWFQRGPQITWHTPADGVDDVSPDALRQAVAAAVHLLRHAAAHPGAFPGGIPQDQADRIREYVRRGAPVW
ncbi:MAG: M20/M25/M40 family metallo-hydrolase, partial [Gemmatimonadota bacterium]